MRLTKEAGFDWLKQQVVWFYTEPDQKGVFDWRELDKVTAAVRESGLRFLISVVRAPAWALGDRGKWASSGFGRLSRLHGSAGKSLSGRCPCLRDLE